MITGFNTDIDQEGRVFHVQTEDKGLDNPVVESLIYCGGEVIECRRNSYADLSVDGDYPEDEILMRMEAQHQAMIREIRNGKFDTEGPKPFGHNIITNRSLDEVVLEFLEAEDRLAGLAIELVDGTVLSQGSSPTLSLRIGEAGSGRPVVGAQLTVTLISTHDQPRELCRVASNDEGRAQAAIAIPDAPEADMAVLCEATAVGRRAEIRQMVHRSAAKRGNDHAVRP